MFILHLPVRRAIMGNRIRRKSDFTRAPEPWKGDTAGPRADHRHHGQEFHTVASGDITAACVRDMTEGNPEEAGPACRWEVPLCLAAETLGASISGTK